LIIGCLAITACSDGGNHQASGHGETAPAIEKGEHNGRLLHDKGFTLELAIFETGVPPEYRAWAFVDKKPVAPQDVTLTVSLTRLGDKVDTIRFAPQGEFLRGDSVIYEPHSFIVSIEAVHNGQTHRWKYESFEGRTRIEPAVADALGIQVETAGPARLQETIDVFGKVTVAPGFERAVEARFPGQISAVHVALGDNVKAGQALLTVESNESLKAYTVSAPISGVVASLSAKVGEQSQNKTLLRIIDHSQVAIELAVFPEQLERVKRAAPVSILYRDQTFAGQIEQIAPELNDNQAATVRVNLAQSLPIGATVTGRIQVDEYDVPLAVKRTGLQAFRDFTVVYAQVGDEYEVRMLELGREAGDRVEILGGLEPGTRYVTENSYVIKADVEKSGASHDH
jgi:cobalt-zinc-cadmium efflux system membrane fusion protein